MGMGVSVTYWFNPALQQFVRSASDGSSRVLISSCALIQFDVFQRNTVAGTWDQYPVATSNWSEYVKVIRLTWKAARPVPGGPGVSENVQTAKIIIRNNIEHSDMKTKLNPSQNSGSALVVTLFMITILAVSIAGYLAYTNQQTRLGVRSQTWNMALAVSEAGVEEGLEQLNNNYANLSNDGWTGSGTTYSISRSFPNGSSYTVSIDYSNSTSPSITSRAFVNPPALAQNAPTVFFAAAGTTTTTTDLTRAIRVQTSRAASSSRPWWPDIRLI